MATTYETDREFQAYMAKQGWNYSPAPNRVGGYGISSTDNTASPYSAGGTRLSAVLAANAYAQFNAQKDGTGGANLKGYMDFVQKSIDNANARVENDRNRTFAELERYREVANTELVRTEAEARATIQAQLAREMDAVVQRYAQLGRSANPYVLQGIASRLAARARSELAELRAQMANQRLSSQQFITQMTDQIGQGTNYSTLDPNTLMQLAAIFGQGNANGGVLEALAGINSTQEAA